MAQMQKKNLARPDETRKFDKGLLELVTLGGVTFGRGTFQPGWRWSTSVKPLVKTKSCEAPHLQYHVSGRLHVVMDDGSEAEFGPGRGIAVASRPRRLGGGRRAGRRHRHQRDGRLRQAGMNAAAASYNPDRRTAPWPRQSIPEKTMRSPRRWLNGMWRYVAGILLARGVSARLQCEDREAGPLESPSQVAAWRVSPKAS